MPSSGLSKSLSTPAMKNPSEETTKSSNDTENSSNKKDCEHVRLPENLESIPRAEHFPTQRHRWNTNEEIAALLINFEKHIDWLSKEVKIRPKSGSMLLYSRKKVRYRRDGYCWKKRKDGKTTREDHMKLKVQGIECIYGCYVHSAILPTFHRRCYWLLQNPDIVLVHYLNVPYPDDNKLVMASNICLWADKKEWTKEELISQLKPMFYSEDDPDANNELEISTAETVEVIVEQLMEKQRVARSAAAKNTMDCGCVNEPNKQCNHHPIRRLSIAKVPPQSQHHNVHQHPTHSMNHQDPHNSVSSSRQALVAVSHHTDVDSNQVSSTSDPGTDGGSGISPRYQNITKEGARTPQTALSSSASPSPNTLAQSESSLSDISNNNGSANLTNTNINAASTPLILNLSNVQGTGGLLILNSGTSHHTTGGHNPHPLAAPFTITSYFGQPHPINTATSSVALSSSHQRLHPSNQGHLPSSHGHLNAHHQHNSHTIHQPNVLIKREADKEVIENLKLDVTNGNLALDTGAFANLVTSIESNEAQCRNSKPGEQAKEPPFLGVKSEMPDIPMEKDPIYRDPMQLSSEDIQKTLSANLPLERKSPNNRDTTMDFIDNNMTSTEDDVLANLDAFDMLNDFPELEHYDTSPPGNMNSNNSNSSGSSNTNISGKSVTNQSQQTTRSDYRENNSSITDYSPEWAYPEGGIKVLVTGPWYSTSSPYTVLFDSVPTPTTLVQAGVLRCYCPAHEVGLVTLQVACEGFVISNSVIFEYKKPQTEEKDKEQEIVEQQDEHLLKFTLLQRLQTLQTRVQPPTEPQTSPSNFDTDVMMHNSPNFEELVVRHCQKLSRRQWLPSAHNCIEDITMYKGQTLLHFAARLGMSKLIVHLLRWREENPSLALEREVDALHKDTNGRTPLLWACREGHKEVALLLRRWNPQALITKDNQGFCPLMHAKEQGHHDLLFELLRLDRETLQLTSTSEESPGIGLHKSPSASHVVDVASSSDSTRPSERTMSSGEVFLRPSSRRCDLRKLRHLSVDFPISSEIETGRNSGCSSASVHSWSDSSRRSRITKRPSVDSGINLVNVDSFKRASLDSGLDVLQKHSRNTAYSSSSYSRFDKRDEDIMGSPMNIDFLPSDISKDTVDDDASSAVASVAWSTSGTESSFSRRDSTTSEMGASSAADESRVFTLAEQFIAAIPERIKGDDDDVSDLLSPPSSEPPASDLSMDVLLDETSDCTSEFNFEFSDIMSYRYMDVSTPSSSLSPASSCLPSPAPFPIDSPSPPPTTADFSEYFQVNVRDYSWDLAYLTMSDSEQRELYEAAKIIQKAYRLYKGRKKQQAEQDRERQAAVIIQSCYRRYKKYVFYRKKNRAATLIQNQFRSYCESKRYKRKGLESSNFSMRSSRESTPVSSLKRTFSQRRQHQAARKIQQFMRQTKQKLQRERTMALEGETAPSTSCYGQAGSVQKSHLLPPPQGISCGAAPLSLGRPTTSRLGQGALLSELCRQDSDPLLSTTARHPHPTEENET